MIRAWRESPSRSDAPPVTWYRCGNGFLALRSDDRGFEERFRELYRDCIVAPPAPAAGVRVTCAVQPDPQTDGIVIRFDDPEPLDQAAFALAQFGDRGYHEVPVPHEGWRALADDPGGPPALLFGDGVVLADGRRSWQRLIGNLAIHRLLRLQRDVLFFHAASVAVSGAGCLLVGPKGAGKTTLSLALAGLGHGFYGDELTGVHVATHEIVAFRRATAIRPGPAGTAVRAALEAAAAPLEHYPDGSTRHRVYACDLFPQSVARPARLGYVVLLDGFAPPTRVEPVEVDRALVGQVSPMGCSMWGERPARRTMQLLSVLKDATCVRLRAPTPDAAAHAIEHLVRGER